MPYPLERRCAFDLDDADDAGDSEGPLAKLDRCVRAAGSRVYSAAPRLEKPLQVCRSVYAQAYVDVTRRLNNWRYRSEIEPYRIAWVDPARIEYVSRVTGADRFRLLGAVVGGDWDRCPLRFSETDVYHAFEAHFDEGDPWEETAYFERVVERIEDGDKMWGCDTRAAFERRCAELDELYDTIRENGFKTQRQLAADGTHDPITRSWYTLPRRVINDEIAVDVSRTGELLFYDGRHRFAIARVLGVDEIPILILRRHEHWMRFRDDVAAHVDRVGELPADLADHPDLTPLVERRTSTNS